MFKWLLVLPLSIPTYIAAYAYFDILDVLNPLLIWIRSTIGFEAMQSTNNLLVYLLTALVMSSVLYPYVYLLARASFESQGSHFINVARSLGHSGRAVFWKTLLLDQAETGSPLDNHIGCDLKLGNKTCLQTSDEPPDLRNL